MTDQVTAARYDEILDGHPWVTSRDPFAYVSKGWAGVVRTMLEAMGRVMAGQPDARLTDWCTKEKFGELRVHFGIEGASDADALWEALRVPVEAAERASLATCEACGAAGRLRYDVGWFSTRCDAHAPVGSEPA